MSTINAKRQKIMQIDAAIIKKLASRNKIVTEIGILKANLKKEVVDKKREQALMNFYQKLAEQYHLSPTFIQKLFKTIIMQSRKIQTKRT